MTTGMTWEKAVKILCVRLDSAGDVLMTGPAIRALKESRPGRKITLLTSPAGAGIAALMPDIDDVIVYEAPWLKGSPARRHCADDRRMMDFIRERRYDAAVIFTVYSQNPLPPALFCMMADIPLRLAHCRENPYQLLTDWIPEIEPEKMLRHEVRRQLDLAAHAGAVTCHEKMSLRVPEDAKQKLSALLGAAGVDARKPWLVLHPGATAASRRYPPEKFAEAARLLVRRTGFQIVVTGSSGEAPLVEEVCAKTGAGAFPVTGWKLEAFAALIARAPLLISNNTGPVHMAAAAGTPVVDIYALTNPQHTPWKVGRAVLFQDVPCRYCYKSVCPEGHQRCIAGISPTQVADAACRLLEDPFSGMDGPEVETPPADSLFPRTPSRHRESVQKFLRPELERSGIFLDRLSGRCRPAAARQGADHGHTGN